MYKKLQELKNLHSLFDKHTLMFYRGIFNNKIMGGIGSYIKEIFKDNPETSHQIFSIFIELAQNICFHSEDAPYTEEKYKFGLLMLDETETEYILSAGNFIKAEQIPEMKEACEIINSLTHEELRQYKKEKWKLKRGEKGTGNFGLIHVALKSEGRIQIETEQIDELYGFMNIATTIKK